MGRTILCCLLVLALGLLLAACAPSSTQGPAAWIDQPLDGSTLPLGPQELTAHASDADGVTSLEFYVDGTLLVRTPAGGGVLEHATAGWNPGKAGVYAVSVKAEDSQGNVGAETTAVVTVGEAVTPSPTTFPVGPTSSPMPPTTTPLPPATTPLRPTMTSIPPTTTRVPPTATPVPPTFTPPPPSPTTPPPPAIVSFEVHPSQVQEGQCATFSWRVEGNTNAIYFDGEGVTSPDSRNRCPSETTTYTLVARGPGGEVSQNLTVTVIEAPSPTPTEPTDATPPAITNVNLSESRLHKLASCNGSTCPCSLVISARITDESGVWAVAAELKLGGSPAGTILMSQSSPDFYEAEVGPFTQSGDLAITIIAQDYKANTAKAVRNVTVYETCLG
jgi:hypothetical protein